ncbi:MAG: hypothetical protein M0R06_00930 [Sphaerochaeta sp.]|nr:hypothetical protein [Sphaerochaeta sp.]
MNPRQIVDKVQVYSVTAYVRRPYVVVVMEGAVNDYATVGIGISKVCWPDRWNEKKGLRIAEGRAKLDIARQSLVPARSVGEMIEIVKLGR